MGSQVAVQAWGCGLGGGPWAGALALASYAVRTMRVRLFELATFRGWMATIQDLVVSGRNELWTVEAEG